MYHGVGELLKEQILDEDCQLDEIEIPRVYLGEFNEGKPHGGGILYHEDGKKFKYRGQFLNGLYDGIGEVWNSRGDVTFRGNFLNGKRHGFGIDYWPNNAIKYTGEYKVDERCGYGTEFDKFGFKVTEGNWYDGEFLG